MALFFLLFACKHDPLDSSETVDSSCPLVSLYVDADGDGYGSLDTVQACVGESGTVDNSEDCDDSSALVFPGATEEDCSDPVDYNCDGSVGYEDADADGWAACEDCDDSDEALNPDAIEVCDGLDNDCDGSVDDDDDSLDRATGGLWYADADADGFATHSDSAFGCEAPEGYLAATEWDCDDDDDSSYPGADEYCDGTDHDCDGDTYEEDSLDAEAWYLDDDEDGHGAGSEAKACEAPEGWVSSDQDCDDTDSTVFPGADELCDGLDNDCDSTVPSDESDVDVDGWVACQVDGGGWDGATIQGGEDCDDGDDSSYPGADEYCDGTDHDCDGDTYEEDSLDVSTWWPDGDGDGYGAWNGSTVDACSQPSGYASTESDCDDAETTVYTGATELCDGQDNDCDLSLPADESDDDGDGYVECTVDSGGWDGSTISGGEDCDDGDDSSYPGADEYCDGNDYDCDGSTYESDSLDASTWWPDADGDGYGAWNGSTVTACSQPSGTASTESDCDDTDTSVYEGATELCDGLDNDCDLSTPSDETDDDGDGYVECIQDSGGWDGSTISGGEDCDDGNSSVNPGATEVCDGVDNECDGDTDEGLLGTGASCPATDCQAVLANNPSAASGSYTLGAGSSTYTASCQMSIDGGGWTQLTSSHLATLSSTSRNYLYTYGSAWYRSPTTSAVWSWSSYQVATGTYTYASSGNTAQGSFSCSNGEGGHRGVGCSNGPGGQWKTLPWGGSSNTTTGTTQICQDKPGIFGGACRGGVQIWVR